MHLCAVVYNSTKVHLSNGYVIKAITYDHLKLWFKREHLPESYTFEKRAQAEQIYNNLSWYLEELVRLQLLLHYPQL